MIQTLASWFAQTPYAQDYIMFIGMVTLAFAVGLIPFLRAPFQWMETYYHELSHGLAALLTFGRFRRLKINWDGSGYAITAGGWRIIILLAGYMGAALWGGYLYLAGWLASEAGAPTLLYIELAFLAIATFMWVRDLGTLLIVLIMAATFSLPLLIQEFNYVSYFIQFIGIYVILNAIRAPLHLIDGQHVGDGAALQNITKIFPEFIWITWWFVFAIGVLGVCAILTLPGMKMLVAAFL